ncbi:MAG: DUF433 domain-containing protein [Chthoniobacterales bacterium]
MERIELNARVCNGKPVVRGTRIPVHVLIEQIAAGKTWEYLLSGYPGLTREDIQAALLYASAAVERTDILAPAPA